MPSREHDNETQDPTVTAQLVQVLSVAGSLRDRLAATVQTGVSATSNAAKDQTHPLGHHTGILAADLLSSGIEHLVVWERLLLAGFQPLSAHVTLIRGAMEGAVSCRWLVEPRTDTADRVRRGVALLLEDYANRRDFERDLGIPADRLWPRAKGGAERYADLKRDRDTTDVGRMEVPKMTARFGGYALVQGGTGRAIYRLLSAHAHGKQWKGLTTKLELVTDAVVVKGGRVVKVTANDDMSLWLSALAIRVSTVALAELKGYQGLTD